MGRITFKTNTLERISSHGLHLGCPVCAGKLMLKDTRDGDQAYWCHTCNRGWRAGHLPPEARQVKAKVLESTETPVEPITLEPEPITIVSQRVPKAKLTPAPITIAPEQTAPVLPRVKTPRSPKTKLVQAVPQTVQPKVVTPTRRKSKPQNPANTISQNTVQHDLFA